MGKPWRSSEDAIIREFYPSEGGQVLGRLRGRDSIGGLFNRACRLGVGGPKGGPRGRPTRPCAPPLPDVAERVAELRDMLEQFDRIDPHSPYAAEAKRRLRELGV